MEPSTSIQFVYGLKDREYTRPRQPHFVKANPSAFYWGDVERKPTGIFGIRVPHTEATDVEQGVLHVPDPGPMIKSMWNSLMQDPVMREDLAECESVKPQMWAVLSDGVAAKECMISYWEFRDAPEDLRHMSEHGGDEDWLAVIPHDMMTPHHWQSGTYCDDNISRTPHPYVKGLDVVIGAHA